VSAVLGGLVLAVCAAFAAGFLVAGWVVCGDHPLRHKTTNAAWAIWEFVCWMVERAGDRVCFWWWGHRDRA
jgi:hypothetical protein